MTGPEFHSPTPQTAAPLTAAPLTAEVPATEVLTADVLIVGGGMIGLTMALAVARAGLSVVVAEETPPPPTLLPDFDGRVSALAHGSCQLYRALGLYDALAAEGQPILDIHVTDGRLGERASPFFLHFHHGDVSTEPFGLMVENRHIRQALHQALAGEDRVRLLAPVRVAGTRQDGPWAEAGLTDGRQVKCRLIIACDGRHSPLREAAGIATTGWDYKQAGIVTTVVHERPHEGVAYEHFLPGGPFAILPMTGNRSSLVWTERADLAPALMAMTPADFDAEMRRRFGGHLGACHSVGPRFSYPLGFHIANRFIAPRLALVGDSAHGLHPIAGQGFNLGLRDVAALAEVLADGCRIGLDPGDGEGLARYERWRRLDSVIMATVMDGLNRLFSNDAPPVRLLRDLGLGAVNRLPPLKRFFMQHARGSIGKLPRLLEGRPL